MNHAVLALAYNKLNQSESARAELATVREMVKTRLPERLDKGLPVSPDQSGLWHDWVETHLLLREATTDIEGWRQSSN